MVAFETLQGFWLLLLIPLLGLLRRQRRKPTRVLLTVFPVVAELLSQPRRRAPLLLRLVRRYRQVINALAVGLLALAFNGTHLHLQRQEPSEWLFVVDNPYTLGAMVGGRRILDEMKGALSAFAERLAPADRLRLVLTCPEPRLVRVPEEADLRDALAAIRPAASAPGVDDLTDYVESVARGRKLRGRILLSPRSETWREAFTRRGETAAYWLPKAAVEAKGNAGVVEFDLRKSPSSEGAYTLFFEVASAGPGPGRLTATLANGSRTVQSKALVLGPGGTLRAVWEELRLNEGPVTLALDARDAFPDDDRVEAAVEKGGRVTVVLHGPAPLFLTQAAEAHEDFVVTSNGAEASGPAVDLFGESVPDRLSRPALVVQPKNAFLGFEFRGRLERPGVAVFHPTHPITRSLRLQGFRPTTMVDFSLPETFSPLAVAAGAPLIAAGTHDGQRVVVWNFDPADRGLFLDPSFAILARETVDWLVGHPDVRWSRLPGCDPANAAAPLQTAEKPNVLCRDVTALAAAISLPDTRSLPYGTAPRMVPKRLDLTPHLLSAAIPLLLCAALASAYPSSERA